MHKPNNYTEKELIKDPSFRRWALGSASKEEIQFWDSWVQQSDHNRQKALGAQASILGYDIEAPSVRDINAEWTRIERKLKTSSLDKTATNEAAKFPRTNLLMRVAAVLIIGFGIGWGVFSINQKAEQSVVETATASATTDFGERKTLFMSDGTKIILNANSNVSYKTEYGEGEEIAVTLKGEAFFDVTKRKTSEDPKFAVETRDGKITVLGTRFAVSTRSKSTRVALEEGLVSMDPLSELAENQDRTTYLRPGELAHFSADTDSVKIKKTNPEVYTSWTTPKLVFDETPLTEIGRRIEETFGVKVIFTDSALKKRRVSGSIENAGLRVIVRGLSETLMIQSEIKNDRVIFGDIQQE